MMEPADRPLSFTEREALFDRVDAYLAYTREVSSALAARHARRANATFDCPKCGNPSLQEHYIYDPAGTVWCPECDWHELPF